MEVGADGVRAEDGEGEEEGVIPAKEWTPITPAEEWVALLNGGGQANARVDSSGGELGQKASLVELGLTTAGSEEER
jgi:hypothetical protein